MATERYFNINGLCLPGEHYMVDLTSRLEQIKKMIVKGQYFCINRGRQYGKTTTLRALQGYLKEEYAVVPLDFQSFDVGDFETSEAMTRAFCRQFLKAAEDTRLAEGGREALRLIADYLESSPLVKFETLSTLITQVCKASPKQIVLLIDEVDQAANFDVFVNFLAMLRQKYLDRDKEPTFKSVILAGVHDIRHLKSKIRLESAHNKRNSPWNIAAQFKIDMSFSKKEIAMMLQEYKDDHGVKMNLAAVAKEIHSYTSGYPVMVCWLCKYMDEDLQKWDREAVAMAAKAMTSSREVDVFGSMSHQLAEHPEIRQLLVDIVVNGGAIQSRQEDAAQSLGVMFCYLKDDGTSVTVANRLFEMYIARNFSHLGMEAAKGEDIDHEASYDRSLYIENGKLNMDKLMAGFQKLYKSIFSDKDERFIEKFGRKIFLTYLKPIINGGGSYYMEAQTRSELRTDLVVDYNGERFVIEMKIWRGDAYNEKGKKQLVEYLDYYKLKKGYLLSFCFNKKKEQEKPELIKVGDREVLETLV